MSGWETSGWGASSTRRSASVSGSWGRAAADGGAEHEAESLAERRREAIVEADEDQRRLAMEIALHAQPRPYEARRGHAAEEPAEVVWGTRQSNSSGWGGNREWPRRGWVRRGWGASNRDGNPRDQESGGAASTNLLSIRPLAAANGNSREGAPSNNSRPSLPSSVLSTMRSLLFSPRFSDVRFVCEDGTVLYAHKCILAGSSDYFATAFEGPWGSAPIRATIGSTGGGRLKKENDDSDEEGGGGGQGGGKDVMVWPTSNSPDIIRSVLSFIYTGDVVDFSGKLGVPPKVVDPRALLSVAHEYGLRDLLEEAEALCVNELSPENWKEMVQLAHLYGCGALKLACFRFCADRVVEILTDPDVAALAATDQELWQELREALMPDGGTRQAGSGGGNAKSGTEAEASEGGEQRKRRRLGGD